jgi:uncharacterized protein
LADSLQERARLKKELLVFIALTFVITYAFQLAIFSIAGPYTPESAPFWNPTLTMGMLIPALAAIVCLILFKSPAVTRESLIVFACFILGGAVYILGTIYGVPAIRYAGPLGMFVIIVLNLKKEWQKGLLGAKLSFGKNFRYYLIVPALLLALLILSYSLNFWAGLGAPEIRYSPGLFLSIFLPGLLVSFFIGWIAFFGEEFGWRGYLQDRLFPLLGGYKGVLVLGIIWGLWHSVLITLGYNYPGQPLLGNAMMILFTVVVGIIFSYAVLKTGSIWIAVILHMVIDFSDPLAVSYLSSTTEPILSFGTGLFGIILLGIFAAVLLRSKVWTAEVAVVPDGDGKRA